MASALFTGRPRELRLKVTDVAPPMALYVTQEDQLRLQTVNAASGVTLELSARMLLPDGQIVPVRRTVAPVATRTAEAFLFPLPEGWLLTAMVTSFGSAIRRGQTFIQLQLVRGASGDFSSSYLILSDYVSSSESISWPGGAQHNSLGGRGDIRSITGTDPAAGVEISEAVPTNAVWRPLLFRFSLTTSGAGSPRTVMLIIDDGTSELARLQPMATQAISTTVIYTWAAGAGYGGATANGQTMPMPADIYLREAFRLVTVMANLDGGDNYSSPQYLVEEWLQT